VIVTAFDSSADVLETFNGAPVVGADLEFSVSSSTPIAWVTISDVGGNPDSETVDDLSFSTPEPGSFFLLGSGALGLIGLMRRKLAR
jgi:hypothetical protein